MSDDKNEGGALYRRPKDAEDLVEGAASPTISSHFEEDTDDDAGDFEPDSAGGEWTEPRGVVVSLLAPDIDGDYASFVSLPDSLLIIEDYEGTSELAALADAVEKRLQAPYRARALRVDERRFVVVANEIETVELPGVVGEELLVFALPDGERVAVLDGVKSDMKRPELESVLEESSPCLLRLLTIDDAVWELTVEIL